MPYILSLIAAPDSAALDGDVLERAARALPWRRERPLWLAPGMAAELAFEAQKTDLDAVAEQVAAVSDGRPVDVNILPAAARRKKLLVADMDSTMIGQECVDELADLLGLKEKVAAITERAMRGALAFEPALRERVALLKGITLEQIADLIRTRITPTPGARELVHTMRAHGAYAALVSGGFTLFTEPVAAALGFDEHRSNRLDLEGDALAGTVAEPILGRDAKRDALADLRGRLGLAPIDTLAVGDGANDLAMLNEAGLGVAFRAKPAVSAAAEARIEHGDLTALLYLQGYRRDEFVS